MRVRYLLPALHCVPDMLRVFVIDLFATFYLCNTKIHPMMLRFITLGCFLMVRFTYNTLDCLAGELEGLWWP